MKNRYRTNVNYNVKSKLAARIRQCLYNSSLQKGKTEEYLGCSITFFRKWIQHLFTEGMSWDNIGTWHIDHIKPCDAFDFNKLSDIKECFHWSNLRPLHGPDNIKKGNNIDIQLIRHYQRLAADFKEINQFDVPS